MPNDSVILTPDLGGLNIASPQDTGNISSAASTGASAEIVKQRKVRSDIGKSRSGGSGKNAGSVSTLSQTQFEKLYTPELWSKVLSSPGDAALALTGDKTWEISKEERDTLGATGSIAAQCFAVSDPRYLAACLALIAIIDVYGIRLAKTYADKKAKEKAEKTLSLVK